MRQASVTRAGGAAFRVGDLVRVPYYGEAGQVTAVFVLPGGAVVFHVRTGAAMTRCVLAEDVAAAREEDSNRPETGQAMRYVTAA